MRRIDVKQDDRIDIGAPILVEWCEIYRSGAGRASAAKIGRIAEGTTGGGSGLRFSQGYSTNRKLSFAIDPPQLRARRFCNDSCSEVAMRNQ